MNYKIFISIVILSILLNIPHTIQQSNDKDDMLDDLDDFEFNSELDDKENGSKTNQSISNEDNEVDNSIDKKTNVYVYKNAVMKNVIVNTMRNEDTKRSLAQVLPILRVMTPEQKLALAALVTNQVLASDDSNGLSLDQIKSMFSNNSTNHTEDLMLPITLDIANMFRRSRKMEENEIPDEENETEEPSTEETPPEAQGLHGKPTIIHHHHRGPPPPRRPSGSTPVKSSGPYRRNIVDRGTSSQIIVSGKGGPNPGYRIRKPPKTFTAGLKENGCEQFISGLCLEANDYPLEMILAAIQRNKIVMSHLLAEFKDINSTTTLDGFETDNSLRRAGNDKGFMCPSTVKYARPKKARSTNGIWKYIVNTADHTQTLRLEKCTNPRQTCSYLNDNFKSRCLQVYNYHRLLTWDKSNGLHMDIFKVPTCCSCHIEAYKVAYPPVLSPVGKPVTELFPGDDFGPDPIPAYEKDLESNPLVHSSQLDGVLSFGEPEYESSASNHQTFTRSPTPNKIRTNSHTRPRGNLKKPVYEDQNVKASDFSGVTYKTPKINYENTNLGFNSPGIELPHGSGVSNNNPKPSKTLSHYLEAPKPQNSYTNRPPGYGPNTFKRGGVIPAPSNINQNFKTTPSVRPKPPNLVLANPKRVQTNRRYPPIRSKYSNVDQDAHGSLYENIYATSTESYRSSESTTTTTETPLYNDRDVFTKRVNYNYHPIIDFFERAESEAQRRVDTSSYDDTNGWRPVTSANIESAQTRRVLY